MNEDKNIYGQNPMDGLNPVTPNIEPKTTIDNNPVNIEPLAVKNNTGNNIVNGTTTGSIRKAYGRNRKGRSLMTGPTMTM
tara:strand:+ start:1897 stop:2136 length:240 start_codon:yes stop_codon:yes gene_type:complete